MTRRSLPVRLMAAAGVVLVTLLAAPAPAGAVPGPPDAPEWWFDSWHLDALWKAGHDGRGITVAVADTGVQGNLAAFAGHVLPGADFTGNGTDGRTDFDREDFSHGTAMTSLIIARDGAFGVQGVAPGANVLPMALPLQGVNVGDGPQTPDATTYSIKWAADHGAKIISMSLGGVRDQKTDTLPCPRSMQDAIVYALRKGAIVLAASGNSGTEGSPVEEPGVCLGVVSVGAVTSSLAVADFSSRHPYLTMAAPGDNVPSLNRTDGRAFVGSGTSQATALAAAAMAVVWSAHPKETNRQILTRVLSSAKDLGVKGRDSEYGYGFIQPDAAAAVGTPAADSSNPVWDAAAPLIAVANAPAQKVLPVRATVGDPKAPLGAIEAGADVSVLGPRFQRLAAETGGLAVVGLVLLAFGLRRRKPAQPNP